MKKITLGDIDYIENILTFKFKGFHFVIDEYKLTERKEYKLIEIKGDEDKNQVHWFANFEEAYDTFTSRLKEIGLTE